MKTYSATIPEKKSKAHTGRPTHEKTHPHLNRPNAPIIHRPSNCHGYCLGRDWLNDSALFEFANHIGRKVILMKWDVFKFDNAEAFANLLASLQRNKAEFHTIQEGTSFVIVVYSSFTK
tara:strand:+ start:14 stop:370 length:357 start_codon:yes stop_codon:yes gene_type:complete